MPTQPLDTKFAAALVAAATTAPSMHNAQPWRFCYTSGTRTFELRPDLERAMPATDPGQRALHLGCAAALFNLRVAAAHENWETETRLLPDAADPHLLATVRLTGRDHSDRELAMLFPAVYQRHTSRYPFEDKEIPVGVEHALREAAREEGAQLVFPDAWHVQALLDHVHDVEGRDLLDPARVEDVRHWTRLGADSVGTADDDGIPEYAFGPRKRGGRAPVRDFAGRRPTPGRAAATFEAVPHLALLGTSGDRLQDWLRAGQAMERVLLTATLHGLATSLTSHSLEQRDLRELARDPRSAMGFVQMVLRLGYGPAGPTTPRRPVHRVLDIL